MAISALPNKKSRYCVEHRTISSNLNFEEIVTTTYINMQDAYVVEKGDAIGTWLQIGYTGPGSNGSGTAKSAVFGYKENSDFSTGHWVATPQTKLNDCTTAMSWKLSAKLDNTNEGQANVAYKAFGDNECRGLTPAFDKLTDGRSTN